MTQRSSNAATTLDGQRRSNELRSIAINERPADPKRGKKTLASPEAETIHAAAPEAAYPHAQRLLSSKAADDRRSGGDRRTTAAGRRRSDQSGDGSDDMAPILTAGPFRIDDLNKLVFIEDKPYRLSPKEYALLKLLILNQGRVVSNQEIITCLWPRSDRATSSDVKQYVHLLRKRVEKNPRRPYWVQNVKGFGYQLILNNSE